MAQASKAQQKHLADLLFPVRSSREVDDEGILNVPPNERRLQTETYDFTISTIYNLLRDGKIIVPEFQRKYVWNRNQASRLIESLIIQCPIPVIYLDQEDDGTLKVIDGNQRLMTLKLFIENGFKLRGLAAFPDLNGNTFSDLDPRFQNQIENRTLRCITILKETHPQIKFDVFERLNTGAVQLNPQELRHGLYHGSLMDKLDEWGQYEPWKLLSGIKDDKRMRGSELILRFLALTTDIQNYEKPLAIFLNKWAQRNQNPANSDELYDIFKRAVDGTFKIFGNKAFRLLDEDGEPENNFNAAIFDAQMVGFTLSERSAGTITAVRRKAIVDSYRQLQTTTDFNRAISASTSDEALVRLRVMAFRDLIQRVVPA